MAVASLLIKEEGPKPKPVYFISKTLNGAKSRYSNIKKLAYSLVISTQKHKTYFESHPIIVYTNAPLRKVFHKMHQFGRMLLWSIELCGQDITFVPRTTIKVQAMVDFLAKWSFKEESINGLEPKIPPWTMMVDGSINTSGLGVGMVLISPNQQYAEKRCIKLKSTLSNSLAEYEALIIGMRWTHEADIKPLSAYSDS